MRTRVIGAIALVVILLVTALSGVVTAYNTDSTTAYNNPTSQTYAKSYDNGGLSIVEDYENDNYEINNTNDDDVGIIVSDSAIIDFNPENSNVSIYYGNRTAHFTEDFDVSANLTNCTSTGFVESSTTLSMTVTALYDAQLPATITVTVGGVAYSGYTWNATTGAYSMPLSAITDSVSITISAELPTTKYYDSNNNEYTLYSGTLNVSKGLSGTGVIPDNSSSGSLLTTLGIPSSATTIVLDSTITTIGKYFAKGRAITSLTTSAETIKDYAFYNCQYMTSLTLNEGVKYIREQAFYLCKNIQSIIIPYSCVQIENYGFANCQNTTELVINGSVIWDNYVFQNCLKITSVDIPDTLVQCGTNVFSGCANLETVTISENLTDLGTSMFYNCRALDNVVIPNSVTNMGASIFNGCTSLSNVTLSSNATYLGSNFFNGCTSLRTVTMPSSITTINQYAFKNCGITSISLQYVTNAIGTYAFQGCTSLTTVDFGNYNKAIPNYCFDGCTSLTTVNLGNATALNQYSFKGCTSLQSIAIPSTVTTWQNYVFQNCAYLYTIYMLNSTPITMSYPTTSIPTITTIYVPTGSLSAYQSQAGWSTIASRIVEGSPPVAMASPMMSHSVVEYNADTFGSSAIISTVDSIANDDGVVSYTYSKMMVLTSLTITYNNNMITLTGNSTHIITIPNVEKVYLINKVLTDSQYYVYTGNIASAYYVDSDDVLTYSTANNGSAYKDTTTLYGVGTATKNSDASYEYDSIDKYPANSTPVTVSGLSTSDQHTILEKAMKVKQGERFHTEYLIAGLILLILILAVLYKLSRKDSY